jgi:altronate dehydratase large subunit
VIISETSEFFGAEHLFAERAVNDDVRRKFVDAVVTLEKEIKAQGIDLRGSNPTPDNIRGGLTTIEEKALGAMAKAGTSPLTSVVGYGETPIAPGLHFMNAPAPAVESISGLAAAGFHLILVSAGVVNPIGHPVSTLVKVSGNRNTVESFDDNLDFDVTSVLEAGEPIDAVGERLLAYALSVASGELTSSEILDVRESAISRFGPSM